MNTIEAQQIASLAITNGWLKPSYRPKSQKPEAFLKQQRECMQRLRDRRRSMGLNAEGKPRKYSAGNLQNPLTRKT